jgi:hypothetical protein
MINSIDVTRKWRPRRGNDDVMKYQPRSVLLGSLLSMARMVVEKGLLHKFESKVIASLIQTAAAARTV